MRGYWKWNVDGYRSDMEKKLPYDLEATVHRVLDAKFSAETAPGVGRSTALFAFDKTGKIKSIGHGSLGKIREVWEMTTRAPEPEDALHVISTLLN
jgi:hypothetical protein